MTARSTGPGALSTDGYAGTPAMASALGWIAYRMPV